MSRFGNKLTGGGGVRPRGNEPPRGGYPPRGGNYGGRGDGDRSQPDHTVPEYWPGYLDGGYFDSAGNLKVEYVARLANGHESPPPDRTYGVEPLVRVMANAFPKLKAHQLRRYFGHCRAIETKLKAGTPWEQVRAAAVMRLEWAAADAYGKADRKIPGVFYDFILRNVAAIRTGKDFTDGFLPHFEALVGFGSLHLPRD